LNGNSVDMIENLDGLWIEELYLSQNRIKVITGVSNLPVLKTIDLSKNSISRLRGLEAVQSLRFLNLSLNNISKVR